jgi:hypothetical protein
VVLKGPSSGPLKITMTSAVALVEGVIVDADGRPVSGRYALFRAIKPGLQPVVMGIAKPKGHFSAVLPPGEYRVDFVLIWRRQRPAPHRPSL